MSFNTDIRRLKRLLESFADRKKSQRHREKVGKAIAQKFPPKRRTGLYASLIRDESLSDNSRWVAMLMLYYVGNDHSVNGLRAFIEDPSMSPVLKLNAVTLLFSLNPRITFRESDYLPKFPMTWLQNAVRKLPPISEKERRQFVIEELLTDLFEEEEEK